MLIMVSPRSDTLGGMSTVLSAYKTSRLTELYRTRFLETIGDDSFARRLRDSAVRTIVASFAVLRAPKGSLVHVHMAERGSFYRKSLVLMCAHARRLQTVVHMHGAEFDAFVSGGPALQAALVRRVLESAGAVIALSETWRTTLCSIAPRANVVVIGNPVAVPADAALSAERDGVLFLGRIGARKGAFALLSAIRLMQDEGTFSRFTLAGDGAVAEAREIAAGLPAPHLVDTPGWVPAAEVHRQLLSTHGIFCLPSHAEGQPIALLEAMAAGMACVVTPVGGIPDTVRDGMDALVVPVDDARALADALTLLAKDARRRVALGRAAQSAARERFGLPVHLEALMRLYADLGFVPRERAGQTFSAQDR
jgi:glycosyltransferase involved in cell wall biosynthesis